MTIKLIIVVDLRTDRVANYCRAGRKSVDVEFHAPCQTVLANAQRLRSLSPVLGSANSRCIAEETTRRSVIKVGSMSCVKANRIFDPVVALSPTAVSRNTRLKQAPSGVVVEMDEGGERGGLYPK